MKRTTLFIFSLLAFHFLLAQQFGGTPPQVRWQQINTDTVRVIYPRGLEGKAQRIAHIVHVLQKNYAHNIGDTIRKINIVLNTQTLLSNAYVALAPYRSEFYLTAPQNAFELGAVSWPDNLSVHEFRHVQQYSNFNKGLSHLASVLFGEQGLAVANAAAIPDWFYEGDAVFNETKFTRQGRGRLPFFLSNYKALYQAGRQYSYMKMRNGSLRDFVPDHYALGYLLVAYGREKYGDDIWHSITGDAASFHPLFYPFQAAVKKYTGRSFNGFVNDAMLFYQRQWEKGTVEKINWITASEKHNVVNYRYPYSDGDGALIVLKTSTKKIPAFYKIHADGKEEKISVKDISEDDYFSYNNGKIIYTAYQPDPRWGNREYHSVQLIDLQDGSQTNLWNNTKYFSPDISHDGASVAAVNSENDTARLDILDVKTRQLIASFATPAAVFSYPKFSSNDQNIYWISRNNAGEMAINKRPIQKGNPEIVLPYSNRIIGFLQVQGDTLLFSASYKGHDEVWALIDGPLLKGPFRLAAYSTGIYQSAIMQNGNLAGSAFTADGFRLGSFKPLWENAGLTDELSDQYLTGIYKKEDHSLLDAISTDLYPETKYKKSFHLLNFHSFRPYYSQPEYSLTLYGENVLNTFQSQVAYTYNYNEASHKIGYDAVFGGTYLQPVAGISQTWGRTASLTKDTLVNWNETVAYAGLQLPLNLTRGRSYRYLTVSSVFNTDQVYWTGLAQKLFTDRNFNYLTNRLSYSSQLQKSLQEIYPNWGQNILLQYRNVLSKYTAGQLLMSGSFFLPGLAYHHSIVVTAAYQGRDTLLQYLFSNNFPFARGYRAVDFPRMWNFGVNYHFPLAFPDWGFGQLVYFQRIRANLFYDHTTGKSLRTGITYPFQTIGMEIFFDTRWWNQQPVTFGFRYSRLLNNELQGTTRPGVWEVLLPVSLFK